MDVVSQGAEAVVFVTTSHPYCSQPAVENDKYIIKYRPSKKYRHPKIDAQITKNRTVGEVRFMNKLEKLGINSPSVISADYVNGIIWMEFIGDGLPNGDISSVKNYLWYLEKNDDDDGCVSDEVQSMLVAVGRLIGELHANDMIHGDLTSSNILLNGKEPYLIDFGLSSISSLAEDKAVDIYVLERAIESTHSVFADSYNKWLLKGYVQGNKKSKEVLARLEEVRLRGRKRSMLG
ncbi:EKC/KEOPS complex subunit Bud32p [[Candida] jaroonii]|uniref:EKC/KEOPS complex subunit Bud32p n=1 Tax=[Candida] jaroonii TaxID=467808 RepID=A0ACA9YA46_9ASCO|nr:EKC/KEOPS complex subunit Bud32p [[Candida] jaroonii]